MSTLLSEQFNIYYESESEEEDFNEEYHIDIGNDFNIVSNIKEKRENETKREIYIKDDYESVITLSNLADIVHNKKIQQIKQVIDTLLINSFLIEERIQIHSIYNYNLTCLQKRNRFLQEFVLILSFLENSGIKFTENILNLVFPKIVPHHYKKKRFEKIKTYVNKNFNFSDFNNKIILQENILTQEIQKYIFGFLFYIKNKTLLYKDNGFTKNEQILLCNILLSGKNNLFCFDYNLKKINNWLTNLVRNLLIYNMYNLYNTSSHVFKKKNNIEYHINTVLRIIINFIISVHNCEKNYEYIKLFLLYNDNTGIGEKLIKNKMFISFLQEILTSYKKPETLKRFKMDFSDYIKKILISNSV